jgi:hypothetical protein
MRDRRHAGTRVFPSPAGAVVLALVLLGTLAPPALAATLFDRIGIGADWGPHWSTAPQPPDVRDNQPDGAFPAEICLIRNAGFKSIRMYGESIATWLAVLDAVDDYNTGKLNCDPASGPAASCDVTGNCMSVVYQAAICGPDPRSLDWKGAYADIGQVKCYDPGKTPAQESSYADSLAAEVLKLKQVLGAAGDKFGKHVPLVFVGNEILFSRGVCSAGSGNAGAACTDTRDCGGGGTCAIPHYCSDTLTGSTPPAQCTSSASCNAGATCTDVANVAPLQHAFTTVQQVLTSALPAASQPAISISLQVDVMTSGSLGDDGSTLMYSRQQLAQALPSKVIAVNTYPDQWGKSLIGQTACSGAFPSCVGPSNAVLGQALLTGCADDPRYRDPRTGKIAHTIDNYMGLLKNRYYPGFEVMIAETGWHTAGTCAAYNDCTATYSPQDAATYWASLYAYAQTNKIPLLAFEAFDERTKQCDPLGRSPGDVAEANYGLFSNFCQLKGDNTALLPPAGPGSPGPNLRAFQALLDKDPTLGGPSCRSQTLLETIGLGSTGVCEHNTTIACTGGYHLNDPTHTTPMNDRCPPGPGGTDNRCVWGFCENNTALGCNPDDPTNPPTCGQCQRAGNCFASNPLNPAIPGLFVAQIPCVAGSSEICGAACWPGQGCNTAQVFGFTCTDSTCACYAALAPSTSPAFVAGASPVELPGFVLTYGKGPFTFTKSRTLRAEVFPGAYGTEVHAVWGNAFVGKDWTVTISAPPGSAEANPPGPCPENSVTDIGTNPAAPIITWESSWAPCSYQVGGMNAIANHVFFPRAYLSSIPTWPPEPIFCFSATGCGAPGGAVIFSAPTGKAQNVGVNKDSGNLRLSGRFTAPSAMRLDLATITLTDLLDEETGVGELSRRPGGGELLPLTLTARTGGKATAAKYQTPSGAKPSVTVEVKTRDTVTRAMEFSITVDRDSMPVRPSECGGTPSRTDLHTSFTIDDGRGFPLRVSATLPWQCRGTELRVP